MANTFNGRQWNVDTAYTIASVAQGNMRRSNLRIKNLTFCNYAVDTDSVVVQDRNGNTIWRADGQSDLAPLESGDLGWVAGLAVPTLSAGLLIVQLG